eukprot:scaffold123610_cov25-Tisochrysis_lutea.AAC.2
MDSGKKRGAAVAPTCHTPLEPSPSSRQPERPRCRARCGRRQGLEAGQPPERRRRIAFLHPCDGRAGRADVSRPSSRNAGDAGARPS